MLWSEEEEGRGCDEEERHWEGLVLYRETQGALSFCFFFLPWFLSCMMGFLVVA